MKYEELTEILEVGMKAISTCNNQPWRFRIQNETLNIFMLRTKNFFLKLEGNTWIELGTFLENLSVAAAAKAYKIEYQLFERCGLDEPAATVRFISANMPPVDIEPLLRRCTNRAPYSETPLPKDIQDNILKSCDIPDIEIRILSGTKKKECADILNNLENVRLGNALMIEEVLPYIRIEENEIETARDRLDVRTMELNPTSLKLLKFAKKYRKAASLLYTILNYLGVTPKKKFAKILMQSGALIAFSIQKRDQESYVHLGRIAQRVLNNLTAENIQTYTIVSGLYLLDLLKENLEIFSEKEQILLLRYQYDLQSLFNFTDRRIALFIRAGYADPPRYRSIRKHAADVIIDEKGNSLSGK